MSYKCDGYCRCSEHKKKTVANLAINIPENCYNIQIGYTTINDFALLLRLHKNNPDVIQFLSTALL